MDEQLALSVVRPRRSERRKRCNQCWELTLVSELHPDYNDEDRQTGWVCGNCY